MEPRRLLTAVTGSGFDPDVLPHEFTYVFDTSVADSLHDEDFSVENLTTNWRSTFGLSWAWQPATNPLSLQPDTSVDNPVLASGNY